MLAVHMCIPCMYMHTYTHVMSVWCYISSVSMYVCVHMYVCAYLYTCNAYIYAYIRNEYIMIYIKRVAWGPAFLNFLMGILQWTRETGLSLRGEIKDFLKRHLHHGNVQCLEGVKGVFILIPPPLWREVGASRTASNKSSSINGNMPYLHTSGKKYSSVMYRIKNPLRRTTERTRHSHC